MSAYFDTGVIAKWYVPEVDSHAALAVRRKFKPPAPLTALHRLEVTAAWHLKVFRGELSLDEAKTACDDLKSDLDAGVWSTHPLDHVAVYTLAERLCRAYSPSLGTRTLDTLHVATAVTLGKPDFVTSDRRQAALARKAGLKVTTP